MNESLVQFINAMSSHDLAFMLQSLAVWALGLLAHAGKKCFIEGKVGLKEYILRDRKATATAISTAFAAYAALLGMNETGLMLYFAAGYISDSALNRT